MALNFPGPYELRFRYSVTSGSLLLNHQHRINTVLTADPTPGDAFSTMTVLTPDLTPIALNTAVDNYVALLDDFYKSTDAIFNSVELWRYTLGTFEANFISVYDLGVAGASASTTVSCQESRFTFRTNEGGTMMIVLAETVFSDKSAPIGYAALNTQEKALVDFVLNPAASFLWARDTSRPASFNQLFRGTNEATFKRRFRNT